jgi:hypothetical protein
MKVNKLFPRNAMPLLGQDRAPVGIQHDGTPIAVTLVASGIVGIARAAFAPRFWALT